MMESGSFSGFVQIGKIVYYGTCQVDKCQLRKSIRNIMGSMIIRPQRRVEEKKAREIC
jgi:hypothetical protein